MKKHNEGYVLVLVLVVVIVLCLVASAILSGALYNINAQHAQIEKMQEQYAAEGEIEKVIANLENLPNAETELNIFADTGVTCKEGTLSENKRELTLKLEAQQGMTKVVCVLKLTSTADISVTGSGDDISYKVTKPTYEYVSFDVEPVDSEEVAE